jgi:hypothetical protein
MMDLMVSHGSVGLMGFMLLFLSILALFVGGVLLFILSKTRKPLVVFAAVSIAPLLIGLVVTLILEHLGTVGPPPRLEHLPANWAEQIRHYAYIGAGATAFFWLMSALASTLQCGRAQQIATPLPSEDAPSDGRWAWRSNDKNRGVLMVFVIPFLSLVVPVVMLVWVLLDFTHRPSVLKATFKIVLGVLVAAIMLRLGNYSVVAILLACIGIMVALFGTADMAACRSRQEDWHRNISL